MADTNYAAKDAGGVQRLIDMRTTPDNDLRQVMVLGDGSIGDTAPVDSVLGLFVKVTNTVPVSGTVTATGTIQAQQSGNYSMRPDSYATDDSVMPATPLIFPVGGKFRSTPITYQDGDATVFQTNANGVLKVDVVTAASAGDQVTVGKAADNAVAAGNPVLMAGVYKESSPTFDNNDAATLQTNQSGALLTSLFDALGVVVNNLETDSIGVAPIRRPDAFQAPISVTDASGADALVKAATAAKKIYVTDLVFSNNSAVTLTFSFKDNTTVIAGPLSLTAGTSTSIQFSTPLVCSTATAFNVRTSAAGAASITALGYVY